MVDQRQPQAQFRVLVLAPSLEVVGGIQRYVRTLVQGLRELLGKAGVRVLTLGLTPRLGSVGNGTSDATPSQEMEVKTKGLFILRALWEVLRWRPDLIVVAHIGFVPIGWVLSLLFRRRYWSFAYGIEVWGPLSSSKRRALAGSARVVSISEFTRHHLVELHRVTKDRTYLLPPCVTRELNPARHEVLSLARREGNHRVILTVSRLVAAECYKGHDVLLQALAQVRARIPDVLYWVVGDGDDRTRLQREARRLKLDQAVRFLGELSEEDLSACYDGCDVFAMPSRMELNGPAPKGEGFGIVYLEAMMHGKPVIGPDCGAPTEFIRHGEHGLLVDPEDPSAVAAALVELLGSPERARRMGEAARAWVLREYSYPRFVERLKTLLSQQDRGCVS